MRAIEIDYVINSAQLVQNRRCYRPDSEIWTMATDKHDKRKMEELLRRPAGPGPAKYALPGTIGYAVHDPRMRKSPAFSFGQRWEIVNGDCSPGPKYLICGKSTKFGRVKTNGFSFYSRVRETPRPMVPGPGHYLPEKHHPMKERKAPSFSFGSRIHYRNRETVPAPNSYSIPVTIGPKLINMTSSPAYSLNGRPNRGGFSEDLKNTPGPGTYSVVPPNIYRTKQPQYSLRGRNYMPGDSTLKPGPGVYSPRTVTRICAPAFSFGVRHANFVVLPL